MSGQDMASAQSQSAKPSFTGILECLVGQYMGF